MISPPPQLCREGRGWGLRPLPQHSFSFRGGDTPDYILPPHQAVGNIGSPWKVPPSRFFTAAASLPRTTTLQASCGHTLAGRGWLRPHRPLQSCRFGQWRSNEWYDLPELGSRQSHPAWTPGKTLLEGELGRGCCAPANLLSLESRNHSAANWLGAMAGCRFPMGLCGILLPGD